MTINRVKLECAVALMKYLSNTVSLIFLPKTLNWKNLNLLNFAELVINELMKSISKKNTNSPFSIRFITA